MEQPVVIVESGEPAPSAEFAAGVAAATAVQATEDAQRAEGEASAAVMVAGAALDAAESAATDAAVAAGTVLGIDARMDQLETMMFEGFARVSDALAATEETALEALGEEGATAPEAHDGAEGESEGETETKRPRRPKKQRTAFGNSWFFKGRSDR
jgi:hypothetical protein